MIYALILLLVIGSVRCAHFDAPEHLMSGAKHHKKHWLIVTGRHSVHLANFGAKTIGGWLRNILASPRVKPVATGSDAGDEHRMLAPAACGKAAAKLCLTMSLYMNAKLTFDHEPI